MRTFISKIEKEKEKIKPWNPGAGLRSASNSIQLATPGDGTDIKQKKK